MQINKHSLFLMFVLGYFALVLFNLVYVPIVWIDEIMDLDPSMRWVEGQGYNSYLWQYKGSEHFFLANLPLRNLPFAVMGFFFGADVFWIRLPSVLFLAGTCYFLWKLLKHYSNENIAWVVLLFFMFDKGVYESLRSVRCEMQQLFFLSAALYFTLINIKKTLAILLCSLLALVHPASWIISLVIAVRNILDNHSVRNRLFVMVLYITPFLLWFWIIGFDWLGIKEQLISAGEDHTENLNGLGVLVHHFYDRFSIYTKTQPWVWLAVLFAHVLAFRNLVKKKDFISFVFLAHSVFWMLVLAPNYRYNPTMLMLAYLLIASFFKNLNWNRTWQKVLISIILLIQAIPFLSVNTLGILQRKERNPYEVQHWLSENISVKGKTLICGESIGLYWIHNVPFSQRNIEFCAPNYPHKFDFESYDKLILLSSESLDFAPYSEYSPQIRFPQFEKLLKKAGSPTYRGMKLYEVSAEDLKAYCLKIRHGDSW